MIYIGETGGPLGIRINELLPEKRIYNVVFKSKALCKYRDELDCTNDWNIKCKILRTR